MERKLIAVAVATAMGLPMAADAVEGSASGHVNAAIVKVDDGDATLGSGNGSETRFRFTGSEELDNGMTAGVTLELGAGGATGYTGGTRIRHANVSLSSAAGKVTIGQQGTATSGSSFADVGSTWIAGATNWCSYGISSGAACTTNDASRRQVVRYDSPAIGPLGIAVSGGNGDFWDAGATVSGSAGDASYNLRLGFNGTSGSEDVIIGGSVSVGGTGVAATWSDGEAGGVGNEYLYVKLDHTYGDGSVGVYYKRGEDDTDGQGSLWGIGVAHSLGGGATAYAGYRIIDNDNAADETDGVLAGVRVTFN
jgi:predicted porin